MGEPARRRGRWSRAAAVLAGLALVSYPLVVWRGLTGASPRVLALVLLLLIAPAALVRLRSRAAGPARGLAVLPLVTVALFGLAGMLDSLGLVLLVPVAVNATLLAVFGATLRRGALPMIERFARLQESELTPAETEWCRLWTVLWCAFFAANGATAALLAWLAPLAWWSLYNGLLAYVLIGALLLGEWILRVRRFPRARRPAGEEPR